MIRPILFSFFMVFSFALTAQITITQADYGQAGDSIVVGYDEPTAVISVGGTGSQTWDFTSLALNNINTLKFEDPAITSSGASFPDADLAIQRQDDTLFFQSNSSEFTIDGLAGDGFNLGVSIVADFDPNSTQVEFPSTHNDAFVDTAIFDTTVSCAALGFGSICDSARLKRTLIASSVFDAYGNIQTPGGTYTALRQYFKEDNKDSLWTKLPFIGWSLFTDSVSIVHNYRWMANGEDWPIVSAIADAQNGNIVSAEFKIDENVLAFVDASSSPDCYGSCEGSISVFAVGGLPPYSYAWSNGSTGNSVTGLCAGTYTVTVTDDNGDTYTVEETLEDPAELTITGAVQGVSGGGDGAIDITPSGGTGAFTYSWTGPNGFSATSQDVFDIEIGDYTVVVTDENGCDTSKTFTVELTGVEDLTNGGLKLFPNPSSSLITIQSNQTITDYRMTDVSGKEVAIGTVNDQLIEIDVRTLKNGIYFVRINTIQGSYIQQVAITR